MLIHSYHQAVRCLALRRPLTAYLSHIGQEVAVMDVRRVGRDGVEVLTDYGWRVPSKLWAEREVEQQVESTQQGLFG